MSVFEIENHNFFQNRKNRNLDFMHTFRFEFLFDHINPITANSGKCACMCKHRVMIHNALLNYILLITALP